MMLLAQTEAGPDEGPGAVPADAHDPLPPTASQPASDSAQGDALGAESDAEAEATAPAGRALDRGVALLRDLEIERAHLELEAALDEGPYDYDDTLVLLANVGVTRAYLGNDDGAVWAFERLLGAAPGFALDYTTSPKATFLFQKAQEGMRTRRSPEIRVVAPTVVRFDAPVVLELTRVADPLQQLTHMTLHHRVKGSPTFAAMEIQLPSVGQPMQVQLPAVGEDEGFEDETGSTGAIVEVAVTAQNDRRWQVYRGPDPSRPQEIPVGFDAPGPWYTQWWLWALAGGVASTGAAITAASGATTVAAIVLWPAPEEVPIHVEVR